MDAVTKKKFASIFAQIKAEHDNAPTTLNLSRDSDVLVVDGTNRFISCWTSVPTLSENGDHVGGVSGFLTSLGYAIKLLKPTRVIIVFDGKGGSARRKAIFPEYKEKRAMPVRVNRAYEDMSDPETEREQMLHQMVKLIDFLRSLPVTILAVDHIEADDTMAYIATEMFKTSKITIMSADKDFLQLVNDRVTVWSPTKKKLYGVQDVINQYGIHPTNFVYYRILDGDKSDGIDGVSGFGIKTTIKVFPMLTEAKESSVDEILSRAKDCINERKVYSAVVDGEEILRRNYKLMQLKEPIFSGALQLKISEGCERVYDYNKFQFIQKLTAHGMHSCLPNYHVWLQEVFQPLANLATTK